MDNNYLLVLSDSRYFKNPETIITENVSQHEEKPTKLSFELFHNNQQKNCQKSKNDRQFYLVLHIHQHYTGHHGNTLGTKQIRGHFFCSVEVLFCLSPRSSSIVQNMIYRTPESCQACVVCKHLLIKQELLGQFLPNLVYSIGRVMRQEIVNFIFPTLLRELL